MTNTVISYPIPPYSNPPIQPQYYLPSQYFITNITLGVTTIITISINDVFNYVIGQLVRLIIPPTFGTRQLNGQLAYVISLPASNQVELNINSIGMDAFIASDANTQSQILPVGDANTGPINSNGRSQTGTFIPGSFINISPKF
jgi:hypothetical protein